MLVNCTNHDVIRIAIDGGNAFITSAERVMELHDKAMRECGDLPTLLDAKGALKPDPVNHPPHYTFGKIEVIVAIEDWQLGFHLGNVVKYVARSAHKGSELEDLEKAQAYLQRKINQLRKS